MALRYEMRIKGLEQDIIDETLEGFNEEGSAYNVAKKRAELEAELPRREFRRRLGQYLARRGFAFSVIEAVVRRLEDELGVPQDEDTGNG